MTIPRVTKALCSFLQEVCIRCLSRSPACQQEKVTSINCQYLYDFVSLLVTSSLEFDSWEIAIRQQGKEDHWRNKSGLASELLAVGKEKCKKWSESWLFPCGNDAIFIARGSSLCRNRGNYLWTDSVTSKRKKKTEKEPFFQGPISFVCLTLKYWLCTFLFFLL